MTSTQATEPKLFVVATPIGNTEDISLRALSTLKSVDFIIAEDTRHSQILLNTYGIKKPLTSFHAHNEAQKTKTIIDALLKGQSAALISDAGTPLIADPGFPLIKEAKAHQIPVIPIPGPCAFIAALSAAGVACDSFLFVGFLAAKKAARLSQLSALHQENHTCIAYESTHRILDTLEDIQTVFGKTREIVLAKELTKTFEQIKKGTVEALLAWIHSDPNLAKGEFVLIIPAEKTNNQEGETDAVLLQVLLQELPLKQAVKIAARLSKTPKNALYEQALRFNKS